MVRVERWDGNPGRQAIVLPGANYPASMPLLYYSRFTLRTREWSITEVWWEQPAPAPQDWPGIVRAAAEHVLAGNNAEHVLLVGKSIGSLALPLAAERGLPGIWLTPLLNRPPIRAALDTLRSPSLLVGGTDDSTWDGEAARASGHEVLELADAHHGLEITGDPVRSLDLLGQVVAAIDGFVARVESGD